MEITISSRGADPSAALTEATRLKIGRLDRFLDGMELARVHFAEERNPRITDKEICEVVMEGHGHQVQCKVSAVDRFAALDRAVEKLEHQLTTLKSKLGARER
ncbi:MAG TPA: ribosome-associated translation inhibitor RaiA [Acidimicrobiales bacterium]